MTNIEAILYVFRRYVCGKHIPLPEGYKTISDITDQAHDAEEGGDLYVYLVGDYTWEGGVQVYSSPQKVLEAFNNDPNWEYELRHGPNNLEMVGERELNGEKLIDHFEIIKRRVKGL